MQDALRQAARLGKAVSLLFLLGKTAWDLTLAQIT
jgi:hypothetical protein